MGSLDGILHCLDASFEDFLTFTSFRYEGTMKVYESSRWGGSFWHHDLEAPGTKDDFMRRIHRLLGHGDVEATTTRVYIRVVNSTREIQLVLQLRDALQRATPLAKIYLLIIIDLQLTKGAISVTGDVAEGVLFFCVHENLYTHVLATKASLGALERIQLCSDWYAEAIAFAAKFWAGDADAMAAAGVVQSLAEVSTMLQQFDGGCAAYQLFCPRKFRGQQVAINSTIQLPGLIDSSAFSDFVLPPNVVPGQLLLVHAFGMSVHFQMPSDVCVGQWLRVMLVGGVASGKVIWPGIAETGRPCGAVTANTVAAATSAC